MSELNKILKNKFGIDRESKPVKQDKWLKSQRPIEEDLLLQQQLVEAKQKSIEEEELQDIEEQPKPVEKKSLSEDDTKKIAAFSELIKSFGVEIEPEIIEEDLQLQVEDITPVPVIVSHTPVDIREAVKLVKDKTLPTKEETIESTQKLITDVVNNLEDMKDRTEVKEEINEIDLLRREFNALQVQVKQSSTFIGSGAGSGEVRLEFLDDVQRSTAKVNGKFLKFDSSSGKFVGDDPTVSTLALTALDIDGATDIGAAIVDADLFIIDDGAGGTNRKVTASRIKTYIGDHTDSLAADNLTIGDAAILLTTSSGNITIDAAANDSDIILKGTDGNADTTFLTIDGSAAGEATFNAGIVIADSGTIGSASDKDAIAISSGGVVTMNQIPVFSAGINVSGGTIAGTLATAAQTNITSLGTLTTLTVDDITINGSTISDAGDFALDISGDIILDANGADIIFKDDGTEIGRFTNSSSDFVIESKVQDKDIIFKGDDGGSGITALTLDISNAGGALFNTFLKSPSYFWSNTDNGQVLRFGTSAEIQVHHVHDVGLTLTNTIADTDNRPIVLQLKSEEDAIVANDVIASIEMAAGDSDGTDGATVAAGIHAIAEDTFSASANATKLVFTTGVSETAAASATAKMTLSSAGNLTIVGELTTTGFSSTDFAAAKIVIEDSGTDGSGTDAGDNIIDETDSDNMLMENVTSWVTSGFTIRDSFGNHLQTVNGVS